MSGVWDPLRPELDTDPPLDPPLPAVSYVVCSTPRSGSGLLCRGLAETGLAGIPAEYFNVNQRAPLARRWACGPSPAGYADALRSRRTGPDGAFGTKLHWDQLIGLEAEVAHERRRAPAAVPSLGLIEGLLPGSVLVHILRLDVDAQAVSLWTALRTGVWSQRHGASGPHRGPVPYSFAGIERCRQVIVDGDIMWQRFFAANAVAPLQVVFEELTDDYAGQVRDTLQRIRPGVATADVTAPTSRRQADGRSAELLAGFVAERARRGARGRLRVRSLLRRAVDGAGLKRTR